MNPLVRLFEFLPRHWFFRILNVWPTYLAAGIRVREVSRDVRRFVVEHRVGLLSRNYVGTAFGGTLYSMCDPFYMFILLSNLGPEFIVWDKAATIQFKKPGRGRLRAVFEISREEIERVRQEAKSQGKVEPVYHAQVVDQAGVVVAEVEKVLYVRWKKAPRTQSA
jgi:hypothetical protein